jgi:hypothetical protein
MSARPTFITKNIPPHKRRDLTLLLKNGKEIMITYGAFTLDVKSMLNVKLGGNPRWHPNGTQC